jgi:spore maturation protein CgeB
MKILFAGEQGTGTTSLYRRQTLERMGHEVVTIDPELYTMGDGLLQKVAFRLAAGPHAQRLNADILALVERERPEMFWAEKVLLLQPSTLKKMSALGVVSVSYMIDNAFGPRNDPGWRLYKKDIPFFDLHVTQRDVSIPHYTERGAKHVMKVQTAYETTMHYPPPAGWSDRDRTREVSFVGTPYDNRADVLARLGEAGVPVSVSGRTSAWAKALSAESMARIFYSDLLHGSEYREGIWKSKINLSFLTRANQDEYTHKSFEIAGCGGFLLAERCAGHAAKFVEDEEAVFFEGFEELKAKIDRYLPNEAARARIAAAGHERAVRDGYHNDRQVGLILGRVAAIQAERAMAGAGR